MDSFNKIQDTQSHIRNFCIIAHIDHGKSTLADRLLELTGTVEKRQMQEQILDSNPIERERGITIKLAPVRMIYKYAVGSMQWAEEKKTANYEPQIANNILNLIDTPGHVDFSYEVSRSLAACEGAILVVDATQGVQAQTLANLTLARRQKLTVIPVINKIDLPNAQVAQVTEQIIELGFKEADIISISAKLGTNIDQVLKAIVERIPSPSGNADSPLRALVFSSLYDPHKGVVAYVRVIDGEYKYGAHDSIRFMASGMSLVPIEVGYFTPKMRSSVELKTGEVGYIATGLKDVGLVKVGDTITIVHSSEFAVRSNRQLTLRFHSRQATYNLQPLPGYQEPKPMVFLSLFPFQNEDINQVRDALAKLRLSDSAFTFRPISSVALGHGFHCGFLGLLHAEVVQERLTREFGLNLLATAPSVEYKISLKSFDIAQDKREVSSVKNEKEYQVIQSAAEFPDPATIEQAYEPLMEVTIYSPKRYVGSIMQLCQTKRAQYIDLKYIGVSSVIPDSDRESFQKDPRLRKDDQVVETHLVKFSYLIPLSEMIVDFFDKLKSATEGYASLDYEFFDYQPVELVKLDTLLNHEQVDAFSQLTVADSAESVGRTLVDKLKDVIPRQQFAIPIQAAIGGKIIARSDVKPFRKDVTKKLYGGDRTRKDKLLEAQKKGKARMKLVGRVEIPQNAFLQVFKRG